MYLLTKQFDKHYAYIQALTKIADAKENEMRETVSTYQFKGAYVFGLYFLV